MWTMLPYLSLYFSRKAVKGVNRQVSKSPLLSVTVRSLELALMSSLR